MAKPKKPTKTRRRAEKRIAENVGPERSRVSRAAGPDAERFILEEARDVREKKHPRARKAEIVAVGLARARGVSADLPPRGPKGKTRVREQSASAYRKSGRRRAG